ncbi:hypothetical protein HDU85_005074 [Gaertneriomyces sp. JEL0708]|nr:hypothetical protein HDU85_005074 [Gaertneriomyces sp. JEL0708]
MVEQSKAVYFLTGANRGFGVAANWLARPNTTVIAGVRNLDHPTTDNIRALPKAPGASLIIVKLDHESHTDPADAVRELQIKYSISCVDIVLPNAGIVGPKLKAIDLDPAEPGVHSTFEVNVYATLRILRAFAPLLKSSANPRFVGIASPLSRFPVLKEYAGGDNAYIASKVLLGVITTRLHAEEKWLTVFVLNPGWVDTEMGRPAGGKPPLTVQESSEGLVKVLEEAKRESHGGKQILYSGADYPWDRSDYDLAHVLTIRYPGCLDWKTSKFYIFVGAQPLGIYPLSSDCGYLRVLLCFLRDLLQIHYPSP